MANDCKLDCWGGGFWADGPVNSKFGALDGGGPLAGALSGIPKDMISTILDTSLDIFSGILSGMSFPVSFRLHRYMASANSGKRSLPDFVVSESCLCKLRADDGLPYL